MHLGISEDVREGKKGGGEYHKSAKLPRYKNFQLTFWSCGLSLGWSGQAWSRSKKLDM